MNIELADYQLFFGRICIRELGLITKINLTTDKLKIQPTVDVMIIVINDIIIRKDRRPSLLGVNAEVQNALFKM